MIPRPLSLVKITEDLKEWLFKNDKADSPLLAEENFVFLGEIPNMPTHCVVVAVKSGKTLIGYHTDNFIELSDDEV